MEGRWKEVWRLTEIAKARLEKETFLRTIPDVSAVVDAIERSIERFDRSSVRRHVERATMRLLLFACGTALTLGESPSLALKLLAAGLLLAIEVARTVAEVRHGYVDKIRNAMARLPQMAIRMQTAAEISEATKREMSAPISQSVRVESVGAPEAEAAEVDTRPRPPKTFLGEPRE
jgi:hypothetical protein